MYNLTQKVTEKNLFLFEFRNTLQACRLDRSVTTLRHPPKYLSETVQNRNLYKTIIQKKARVPVSKQILFFFDWLWEQIEKSSTSKPQNQSQNTHFETKRWTIECDWYKQDTRYPISLQLFHMLIQHINWFLLTLVSNWLCSVRLHSATKQSNY